MEAQLGSIFLVYEYIPDSLVDIWDNSELTRRDIIQIGLQLIDCAERIHSAGYVHADIKLDNILINSQN